MVAKQARRASSTATKSSDVLSRRERLEALEKARQIQPFVDLANQPQSFHRLWQKIVESFAEVASIIKPTVAPLDTWSDEEIASHRAAQKARQEELIREQSALAEEQSAIRALLQKLARLNKPEASPVIPPPVDLWSTQGHCEQIVFDARNRIHILPLFPQVAALRKAFCQALDGLDCSRIRLCPVTGCNKLYWASRIDKPACSKRCAGRLRSRRDYDGLKQDRERARALRKAGKKRTDIACELGLTVKQVRRFLKRPGAAPISIESRGERQR